MRTRHAIRLPLPMGVGRGEGAWLIGAVILLATLFAPTYAIEFQLLKRPIIGRGPRDSCTTVARLDWHTDYTRAVQDAKRRQRLLVVNFVPPNDSPACAAQCSFEKYLDTHATLRRQLDGVVLARIPLHAKTDGAARPIIDEPVFEHLGGRPGLAILDFQHSGEPYYGQVVTVLPFTPGKYYRWDNSHLALALDLPPGTITQRMMVWAVRTHPEAPQSTVGEQHPALAAAAAKHSVYQARLGVQGHQNWERRFHEVRAAADAASAREVVAESWPDQDLVDSCIDCVESWRHSPGHWRAVRSRHRLFGYDIRRGRNGIWYGTGIFAN